VIVNMLKWMVSFCIVAVAALALWPSPEPYETDLFVPLEISSIPEGLAPAAMPVEGVEIRVNGPEKMVRSLSERQLVYRLDLSGVAPGVRSFPVRPERFGLPREITIGHIRPDPLILRIEKEVTKEVPVKVTLSGEPATGFYLVDSQPIPPTAVIRGPESRLAPVTEVRTRPIDISGSHESIKKEVALDMVEGIRVVTPGGVIAADLKFAEKIGVKTFSAVPLVGKHTLHHVKITPPQIDIEVKGPVNILEKLAAQGIDVYVDLKGLESGVYPRRAVISIPVETTLVRASPEIFTVKIDAQALPENGARQP
jgi:hypothetical protein